VTDVSALLELVLSGEGSDPVAETILDAALEEFLAYGLRRTNVDVVAKRAGVSRATLYRRFDGKDALVQAVLVRSAGGSSRASSTRPVICPLWRIGWSRGSWWVCGMPATTG